jgi:geranylgeranyl pyrophosphate synthase
LFVNLRLGLATAPVLFASENSQELELMVQRRFNQIGDVEKAFDLVLKSDGLERTQFLAEDYSKAAIQSLDILTESKYKTDLLNFVNILTKRIY